MYYDFSILFSPDLYRALENPPPPVTDWDILTLQPDSALPVDGLYDALALVDNASLTHPFTVSFEWLGGTGTTPGAQPFAITEFEAQGNFLRPVETGQTQTPAPVPEPGTFVLPSMGLVGLLGWSLVVRNALV
jgi:PEP-CTERM motif-containing protein